MFVSFRKCSPPQKPDPFSDRNCQNLYPFSDQNGSKTIPFGAAHTYIPSIGEYPPPPRDRGPVLWNAMTSRVGLVADNEIKDIGSQHSNLNLFKKFNFSLRQHQTLPFILNIETSFTTDFLF